MEKETKFFNAAAYIYLSLPMLIFVIGYLKPVYATLAAAVIVVSVFLAIRSSQGTYMPQRTDVKKLIVIAAIVCLWVYLSGIGHYVFQNDDHRYRNAVFEMLTEARWPIIFNDTQGQFEGSVAFVYYYAFWLPSAVVGKVFGLGAGYFMQAVWAAAGILLTMYFLFSLKRKIKIWYVLLFIFFSGMDILGARVLGDKIPIIGSGHIEWWAGLGTLQYSSHTTQLFWVFNQAVPAWLITVMMMSQKNRSSIVYLFSLSVLSSAMPAVGLIPVALYKAGECGYDTDMSLRENARKFVKEICTFQNIAGGGMVGIMSYMVLKINNSGQLLHMNKITPVTYMVFIFFEVFVYFMLTWKTCRGSKLYYISVITLIIAPVFGISYNADFCMRVSIPALVILFFFVTETLESAYRGKKYVTALLLTVCLAVGAVTPLHEILRTLQYTHRADTQTGEVDLLTDVNRNNFFGETEASFFFNHLVRK